MDLRKHLIKVRDLGALHAALDLERVRERLLELVHELLKRRRIEHELHRQVATEHARLQRLDVAANVRLAVEQVALPHLAELVALLVGEDDVGLEGLDHQQRLAQRSRAFAQHVVGVHRNDVAQREDERMHVFHVQVVGRDGV